MPVLGKHSKRITCGAWSSSDLLALGSDDKMLSISNADGDTLRVIQLRGEPEQLQFSEMKTDERLSGDNTVSNLLSFTYLLRRHIDFILLIEYRKDANLKKFFYVSHIIVGYSGSSQKVYCNISITYTRLLFKYG